jgi:hypothetical protein
VSEANHNLNRLLDEPGGSRKINLLLRKYLFGFGWLRRGIQSRISEGQAKSVVLATPLAGCDDLRRIIAFFQVSAALGFTMPI